jgi:diaminopimelate epimerase
MHGTGNDFIIINRINDKNNEDLKLLTKKLCNRHFNIGADGLLIVL